MLEFVAGTNKGGVAQGDVFNDPFKLGQMTDNRVNYTSSALTEEATAGQKFTAAWLPVVNSVFTDNNTTYDAKIIKTDTVDDTGVTTVTESYTNFTNTKEIAASFFPTQTGHTITYKVAYKYDNVVIPQESDIPVLNARMKGIALEAKARRIAIYY